MGGSRLDQLREEYRSLKGLYTDQHPSVIRIKKRIEDLEKESRAGLSESSEKSEGSVLSSAAGSPMAKLLSERIRQRASIQAAINSMQEDIQKIDRQIIDYQKRIERTPKREEELFALRRDHENMQTAYKSLLSRKLEADMAVNMEKKKKGEQFEVLDYAKLPEKPVSPNLKKIFALALAIGITLGLGLAISCDFLDESVRHPMDLEGSGLTLLATIPKCRTGKTARYSAMMKLLTLCSISVAGALIAVFAFIAMHS
jgi:uncharacterized protein involved in exopolysaccharide biosynthesis